MPYTPYHFGPSGLAGLLLRRWIDVPVFVLANAAIDLSVLGDHLFAAGDEICHQFLHFHTLLVGGLAGLGFGAMMYWTEPLRRLCEKGMQWMGLACRASLKKMLLAGVLGAWFHVGIDSIHHADVQIFWPLCDDNPVNDWLNGPTNQLAPHLREGVVRGCLLGWAVFVVQYGLMMNAFRLRARLAAIRRFRRVIARHQVSAVS
jgi:hypothetical protein